MQLHLSLLAALFAPALLSQAAVLDLRGSGHLPRNVPADCPHECKDEGGFKICETSQECTVTGDGVRYRKCGHTDCTAIGQHAKDTSITALCAVFGEDIEGNPAWIKQKDGNFLTATYVDEDCLGNLPNCAVRVLPENGSCSPPGYPSSSAVPPPVSTPSLSSVVPSATPPPYDGGEDPNIETVGYEPEDEEDEECEDDEELIEV